MGGALRPRPKRQAAEPGLPLGPAGARFPGEMHVCLYDELVLLMSWFNMNQIFGVFDSILTFVLGVSVPNIKRYGLLIGTSLFRRVLDAPLQFQSSKSLKIWSAASSLGELLF